jgi:hypothetical protein
MAAGPLPRPPREPYYAPRVYLEYLKGVRPSRLTDEQVIEWMKKNPGFVAKNWQTINRTQFGRDLAKKAKFFVKDNQRTEAWLFNPDIKDGARLWTWKRKKPRTQILTEDGYVRRDKPDTTGSTGNDGTTTTTGVDPILEGLAGIPGLDLSALSKIRVPAAELIPLALANAGAKPMSRAEIDQLVSSIVNPQRTKKLFEHDRQELLAQTTHNIKQLDNWYGQVMDSQGVAAQRSADFGKAAVAANADVTQGIISSLGGEANEGSYVVGAAGAENAGLLNALGAIENQYNADITPLLKAEAAGQKAREQAAGTARLRDLSRQLMEAETQGSSAEAQLRYDVWQNNQQILNDRIARRIGIMQANQGARQQRYQNQLGLAQAGIAAQASQAGLGLQTLGAAADYIDDQADNERQAARDAYLRRPKPYGQVSKSIKDSAWNDMIDLVEGKKMTTKQAMMVMASVIRQYGWNPNSPGPRALMQSAIKKWQESLSES